MKKTLLTLFCVAFAALTSVVQAQFTVNFQFRNSAGGGGNPVPVYNGPGVSDFGTGSFWNTVPGPSGWSGGTYSSTNSLADNGTTQTGIKWTLVTSGNWSFPQNGTIALLNSYAVAQNSSKTFTFTNVPDGTYHLVLFGLPGNHSGVGTIFKVNGVSQTVAEPLNANTSFVLSNNYVVFSNLTVSGGTLTGTWQNKASGEGHLNGAQLQRVSSLTAYAFAPTVTPTNYVNAGTQVTLTANAVGVAPVSYQWQTDGGGATLTNIPGATANSLQVNATGLLGAIRYAMVVSDASGSFTSPPVTLTVSASTVPTFTPNPPTATPASTVFVGNQVTFTTSLGGTAPVGCQWQVNKGAGLVNISGATNATLTLTNVQLTDAGTYSLHATNSVGAADSSPVTLTVLLAPPAPVAGSFAQAVLTNSPLGYWRLNDPAGRPVVYDWAGNHPGGNQNVTLGVAGLQQPTYPGFDSANTAGSFDGVSGAITTGASLMNGLTNFTLMGWFNPGGSNPDKSGLFGQNDLVEFGYSDNQGVNLWMPTTGSSSWINLRSGTSGFNIGQWYFVALVADGTNVILYVDGQQRARTNNVGAPKGTSNSGFNIGGGGIYDASANFFNGLIEDVALFNKAFSPMQLQGIYSAGVGTVAPSIFVYPEPQTVFEGRTARFTVVAGGVPVYYQWQAGPWGGPYTNLADGGDISGATTATLTLANVTPARALEYLVLVTNSVGSAASYPVALMVTTKPGGQWVVNFDFDTSAGGSAGTYGGTGVLGTGTYWNSIYGPLTWTAGTYTSASGWADDAFNDTGISLSLTISGGWSSPLNNALLDDYAEAVNGAKPFTFNNVFNGVYNLVLFGINGSTKSRGTLFTVNGVTKGTTNATDTSFVEGDNYVIYRNVVVTNRTIAGTWAPNPLVVGGVINTNGDFCGAQLQYVSAELAPSIVVQPVSRTVLEGSSAQFSVGADGMPLYFRWQAGPVGGPYTNLTDGGNISGTTSATLTLANVAAAQVGAYRVVVTNAAGSVTSSAAMLGVAPMTERWVVNFDFNTTKGGNSGNYSGPGVLGSGTYWNSIPGPSTWSQGTFTSASGLVDDGVTDAGIALAVTLDGNWCMPANNALLDDYAQALNGMARPFRFTNVPNGFYNLVLFGVNGGYTNLGTLFSVNGVTKATVNTTEARFVEGDNYVVFYNLPVTNGILSGTYAANPVPITYGSGTNDQGDFCGAQLQYVGQTPVPLSVSVGLQPTADGKLQLQWSQGLLLESSNITGPWTTNTTATSPFLVTPTGGSKFYRVLLQ